MIYDLWMIIDLTYKFALPLLNHQKFSTSKWNTCRRLEDSNHSTVARAATNYKLTQKLITKTSSLSAPGDLMKYHGFIIENNTPAQTRVFLLEKY